MATSKFNKQSLTAGKNVSMSVDEKGCLTIKIDLTKDFGNSASGKTVIVGTTSGNVPIGDTGVTIGINAYRKP